MADGCVPCCMIMTGRKTACIAVTLFGRRPRSVASLTRIQVVPATLFYSNQYLDWVLVSLL